MIIFQQLRWGNAFSYGPANIIQLDGSPLTQIVGKNGHGKSSIALIIEEVLYNQNSKKIKKADILNRYTKDKNYFIELDFDKDGVSYGIRTTRTSTSSTIKLTRSGVDISSHTATATYKTIEQVLGYDHKTFSQIVYQSSVSSLEFLTATDTARKKFLIELLNLGVYTKAADTFKELASGLSKEVDKLEAKVSTVRAWLLKYEKEDLNLWELKEEMESPISLVTEVANKSTELANIEATNKKITQNNKYQELLSKITVGSTPPTPPSTDSITNLKVQLATKQKSLKDGKSLAAKCDGPTSTCSTCTQSIDNSTMYNMVKQFEFTRLVLEDEIAKLLEEILVAGMATVTWTEYSTKVLEVEKYHALIDTTMSTTLLDRVILTKEISALEAMITSTNTAITKIKAQNKLATDHNSKVTVISEQMQDMRDELDAHITVLGVKATELSHLQVLVKAFSTTGLVAYKIECLVKDLEELTNEYLGELADGRFQLSFKIASADKLNVVITDNSHDVDIIALSSGERARVNVATLLAIRKLMQTLSNSRTNLLILDETVENLDAEGKEKLIEVLLREENLNTFLISHGFSHPLLEKLQVVKDKNMSRIEA
jgi:DNA repair exonuclease SbcCD ATPase subunit